MRFCVGDEVRCPPSKHNIEVDIFGKKAEGRLGTVTYIHPKNYFIGVKIKSISGIPVYTECFQEREVSHEI